MENDISLSNDVLSEILLRLPSKSLGRCMCVCKTWYNLIRNPNFINIHLHHPKNHTRLFAFFGLKSYSSDSYSHDYVFALFTDESLSLRQDIDNPVVFNGCLYSSITSVLGPVNGLYCIHYYYNNDALMALWNPSTSEFRELPLSPFQIPPNRYFGEYLGFGSTDEDVKLVRIQSYFSDDVGYGSHDVVISLYSLADDCWKEIEYDSVNFPYMENCTSNDVSRFTHFNGAYYWLVKTDRDILFLFDMISEVFREVNLPPRHPKICMDTILLRDNSSIVLVANQYSTSNRIGDLESVHLWEMKEEGQWFKLVSFDPSSTYVSLKAFPYGFGKKDGIFVKTSDGKVVLYNINSHETRDLEMDGAAELFLLNYKESPTSVRRVSA